MDKSSSSHIITSKYYSLKDIELIIDSCPKLSLSDDVISKIEKGHEFVITKSMQDQYIYGVNTGFGSLCETRILDSEMEMLQYNHVISHAVGVGPIVPERISRLTMFIKLLTFRWGSTGISMDVVNRFLDFWNNDIIPTIPQKGSVGASGDLAPLAHMGLPLIGLGSVHFNGEVVKTDEAYAQLGWKPLKLKPKEGLAITNGIQYINANAVDSLLEIGEFVRSADVIASMSAQAFSTSKTFYQPLYHTTSYHPERTVVAKNFVNLLHGSNHFDLETCNKSKQDPYSFRCIPQVHGAVRQAYNYSCDIVEKEINSVSDNPLFFPEQDEILFGGALHGESTALTLDFLAIALSELVYVSERRTYQLLSGQRGLPDFLVAKFGLNSGLMIAQYTSAALVNENKVMATPASIDTIPTCQLQEDHVSMGATSAYKLKTIRDNANYVFAIELLHATQAIEFNSGLTLSAKTQKVFDEFRTCVDFLDVDRVISDDIEKSSAFFKKNRRQWIEDFDIQ